MFLLSFHKKLCWFGFNPLQPPTASQYWDTTQFLFHTIYVQTSYSQICNLQLIAGPELGSLEDALRLVPKPTAGMQLFDM